MLKTILAFGCVYFVWGSTYFVVLVGLESLPPFLLSGVRFLAAGSILYLWERLRGAQTPTREQWSKAAQVGTFLLITGVGAVAWAEQTVSSGLAALLVSTVPLWVVVLEWVDGTAGKPGLPVVGGLVLGLVGVGTLVGATAESGSAVGIAVVVLAALSWSYGTVLSRRPGLPQSATLATSMKMIWAGGVFCLVSLAGGETVNEVSARSALALGYLTLFGSLVALSAYVWLVRECGAAKVSTYAYVNPVVAVFLGWAFAGESLGLGALVGAVLILVAVYLIVTGRNAERARSLRPLRTSRTSPCRLNAA